MTPCTTITVASPPTAGAVAIVQLHNEDEAALVDLLRGLSGHGDWPIGRMRLIELADVDRGFVARLTGTTAQIMPHGGRRVVDRITGTLLDLGAVIQSHPKAIAMYPEAPCELEADALATIARAASPVAIDLLAAQTGLWRDTIVQNVPLNDSERDAIKRRSGQLDRLIDPPTVLVVGRPNVGKSTLTNRMIGRSASVVADLPGTTRDWVAGLAQFSGVALRWLDTPGVRDTDDPIEAQAIALAAAAMRSADVLITMRDPTADFPADDQLPRAPDMRVTNKIDITKHDGPPGQPSHAHGSTIRISALTGEGVDDLAAGILGQLGLDNVGATERWAFTPTLRQALIDPRDPVVRAYTGL